MHSPGATGGGRSARPRGFTLLEVLVAVGLMGIVSLLMYESIALTFKTREQIARIEELNHSARVALRKIMTDVSMAYLSNHVNRDEPSSATLFMGSDDSLLFSYLGHERRRRGARESDQGIVEYQIGRDAFGRTIERREKSIPDMDPGRGGSRETLVSRVKEFRLQYWDDKQEEWKSDWKACAPNCSAAQPRNTGIALPHGRGWSTAFPVCEIMPALWPTRTPVKWSTGLAN